MTGPPATSSPTSGSGARGSESGRPSGRVGGPASSFDGGRGGGAERSATATAATFPMTISLPAGRPPWSAERRTRRAVTDACAPGGPAFRLPLSLREHGHRSPVLERDASRSARHVLTERAQALHLGGLGRRTGGARAGTGRDGSRDLPATISPLNSETTIASANDSVAAAEPGAAKTAARERPTLTIDASPGYWNDSTSAVVEVGHSSPPMRTVLCPGIVMRRRNAFAPVFALRGGGAAAARVAMRRALRRPRRRGESRRSRVARGFPARPPHELRGDREQQHGKEPAKRRLRELRREPSPELDPGDRGHAENHSGSGRGDFRSGADSTCPRRQWGGSRATTCPVPRSARARARGARERTGSLRRRRTARQELPRERREQPPQNRRRAHPASSQTPRPVRSAAKP